MSLLVDNGCWASFRTGPAVEARPCLFLDRDGVVIVDRHHLADPAGVTLLPGAVEAVLAANRNGWHVGLVTNQSGIGRGLFTWDDFAAVQARVAADLAAAGAVLDFVCACPHHAGGVPPWNAPEHPWRKPQPGMLLHAMKHLNIAMAASIMVGDRASDIEAGQRAGVGLAVLVGALEGEADRAARLSGHFTRSEDLRAVLPYVTPR